MFVVVKFVLIFYFCVVVSLCLFSTDLCFFLFVCFLWCFCLKMVFCPLFCVSKMLKTAEICGFFGVFIVFYCQIGIFLRFFILFGIFLYFLKGFCKNRIVWRYVLLIPVRHFVLGVE